jgi:ribonuclease HII
MIDDSKRLTAARREAALLALLASGAVMALGAASVREIADHNILRAALLAMRRAVGRLGETPDHILVDGKMPPGGPWPCTVLVGGDGISLSIAAASIFAKVTRDRLMVRLAARYPAYGWERNAGYAAAAHRAAIIAAGACPHHRRGFGALLSPGQ